MPKESIKNLPLILAIFVLAVILRLFYLTHQSLWSDEIYDMWAVSDPFWSKIPHIWRTEIHPPFYIILLKGWTLLFGLSDLSARYLSVAISLFSLYYIFQLTKCLSNERVATFTLFLCTISPLWIYYAQEVRQYGLWILFSLGSYYAFFQWIYHGKRTEWKWCFFTICSFYIHIYSLFILVSQIVLFLISDEKKRAFKNFNSSAIAIGFVFLSLAPIISWTLSHLGNSADFAKPFTFAYFGYLLFAWTFGYSLGPSLTELHVLTLFDVMRDYYYIIIPTLTVVVFILVLAINVARKTRLLKAIIYLMSIIIVIIVCTPLFSKINFNVRSTLFIMPFFYILLGIGVDATFAKKSFIPLSILLVGFMLFSLAQYYFNPKFYREDIRGAVVTTLQEESDPILVGPAINEFAVRYYGNFSSPVLPISAYKAYQVTNISRLWVLWNRMWIVPDGNEIKDYFQENYEVLVDKELPGVHVQLLERKKK